MDKDGLGSGPQALRGEGPQAVSVRVAQWRAAHAVRLDEDFAFAFCWAAGHPSFSPSSAQAV